MINAAGNRMTREIARQSKLSDQLDRIQTQISSGKKLLRASDDPVASRRIATIGKAQASSATWAANVKTAAAQGTAQGTGDGAPAPRDEDPLNVFLVSGSGSVTKEVADPATELDGDRTGLRRASVVKT